jgi:hypothetical protein
LVSINVPNDKARAVVDAMERDMGTTIATKTDLQLLKQDLYGLRQEFKADLQSLRQQLTSAMSGLATRDELRDQFASVKSDIAELRKDNALIRKDMELLSTSMTVRLGSIMGVGIGILFAALKLT